MYRFLFNSMGAGKKISVLLMLGLCLSFPFNASASKKKKANAAPAAPAGPRKFPYDPTKLVWPNPPNIARVKWLDYFAGEKIDYAPSSGAKPKASWMDRLAGGQTAAEKFNPKTFPFQLIGPY